MKNIFLSAFLYILFLNAQSQNVGIGIATPIAKLEVMNPGKSTVRISSTNYADTSSLVLSNRTLFGAGTDFILSSNQENGLNISSTSDLPGNVNPSILFLNPQGNVGVGNTNPLNKLDVGGSMNISGTLKVGGSSGTAGQVLASNGAAPATWQNSPLSNNTRFSFHVSSTGNDAYASYTTDYNTNTTNIVVPPTGSQININKTGLYHFEGSGAGNVNFSSFPTGYTPYFNYLLTVNVGATPYYYSIFNGKPMHLNQTGIPSYYYSEMFSIDLFITSGSILTLNSYFYSPGSTTSFGTQGWFSGYLISD
jgi:hypothetical protein